MLLFGGVNDNTTEKCSLDLIENHLKYVKDNILQNSPDADRLVEVYRTLALYAALGPGSVPIYHKGQWKACKGWLSLRLTFKRHSYASRSLQVRPSDEDFVDLGAMEQENQDMCYFSIATKQIKKCV